MYLLSVPTYLPVCMCSGVQYIFMFMCTCTCTLHSTALFSPFLHVLFSSKWLPDSEAELFPIESGTDNVTPPFHLSLSVSSLCCCRSFSRNHSYTVILDSLRPKRERESGLCLITSTRKCAPSTSFVRIVRTCHKRHHKRNDNSSSSSRTTSAKEQKDTRKETPKRQSMTVKYVPPPFAMDVIALKFYFDCRHQIKREIRQQ